MRKNDKTLGAITNVLNCGRGDSWNKAYGIFRPMKDWTASEWIQYGVITIVFTDGLIHLSTGMGLVDLMKAGINMIKEEVMFRKNNSEEEPTEAVDVEFYETV